MSNLSTAVQQNRPSKKQADRRARAVRCSSQIPYPLWGIVPNWWQAYTNARSAKAASSRRSVFASVHKQESRAYSNDAERHSGTVPNSSTGFEISAAVSLAADGPILVEASPR